MTKIYLSHPFGGSEENREAARDVAALYRWAWDKDKKDYVLVNPLEMLKPLVKDGVPEDDILREAVRLMAECDVVLFCPGWKKSRGCRLEHYVAGKVGIQRVYISEDDERAAIGAARYEREKKRRAAEAVRVA